MSRRALVLPLLLTGCLGLGGAEVRERRAYDIVPPPRADAGADASAPVLDVARFGVAPALEAEELLWRAGEVEAGYYAEHVWTRPPGALARDAVARALREADLGAVVATEPPPADPRYRLEAYLDRFEEVDREDAWYGVVELVAVLRGPDGRELLRRSYAAEQPAAQRNPRAVVLALRQGLLEVSATLAEDVAGALARPRATPRAGTTGAGAPRERGR